MLSRWLKEDVDVKIDDFGANGGGHMDVTGGGIAAFTCSNKVFTKRGLKITTDLSDCHPNGITISEIDFCSDQDAVKVTVKAEGVTATLSRVACSGRAQHHLSTRGKITWTTDLDALTTVGNSFTIRDVEQEPDMALV